MSSPIQEAKIRHAIHGRPPCAAKECVSVTMGRGEYGKGEVIGGTSWSLYMGQELQRKALHKLGRACIAKLAHGDTEHGGKAVGGGK